MQKVIYGLFLAFTSVALVGCGDGPCDAGFSFKYCLNQSSSSSGSSSEASSTPAASSLASSSSSSSVAMTVGGTVSSLGSGKFVVLQNNGTNDQIVTSPASTFEFPAQSNYATYNVTVLTQPIGQKCQVINSSGTLVGANVTNVSVICTDTPYTMGGSISGLSATGLILALTGAQNDSVSPISGATSYTFMKTLVNGNSYTVAIEIQPAGQTCSIANASGTVSGSNALNINVSCSTNSISSGSSSSSSSSGALTVGGTVSGLAPGKIMKLTRNIVSMANTEAGVLVNFADAGLQVSDNPGSEYTSGWSFTVASNRLMTHLGVWTGGGLYGNVDLGLWDGSGNLLSSISLLSANVATYGLENDFSYAVLPTSVLLTAGQTYTLSGFYKGGVLATYGAPVTPINGLSYATPSLIDFGTSLAQPTFDFSVAFANGLFGPNLRFLTGLASSTGEQITVSIDGSFTFPTALVTGDPYVVEVIEQPADQSCSILNGNGTVASVPVTTVIVTCAALQ